MSIEAKLVELGLKLPQPPAAVGSYAPFVRVGNVLHLSGAISAFDGKMTHVGQVGREQTVATAAESAKICALNLLANIKAAAGNLDAVKQIVFLGGYVNAADGFADSSAVINGASDLFVQLYGEAGRHARAAVAVNGLPKGSTVEIQAIVELK
jgi:enamine deaminase RidA (YjgF/YER057c/UK114 family)